MGRQGSEMAPREDSCCRWSSLPVCLPSDKQLASPTLCQELGDRHKVDMDPHSGTLVSGHGNKWQRRARKASWAPGDSGLTDATPSLELAMALQGLCSKQGER